ncbi:DUF4222 domain-containing protein [Salmonella enterica subsp. enterica serovar Muenchen]|nr:DUF4222 domain-containing protein [Salmonella enterica subsp. enterica serovar Muenchen]EJM3644580.1 DUF4222 domain-containing protein [Salmonella enterica]
MFCLIQRGQIYTDFDGYPVTIYRCDADRIVYRRNDSQIRSVSTGEFNAKFERIEHQEYAQIKAELAREENIRNLRNQARENKAAG